MVTATHLLQGPSCAYASQKCHVRCCMCAACAMCCKCVHRKLERVHAAVMGAHKRHGCLLPLEMYLEEDIPLVCYIRDKPYAEMVELPEQSCHCFLSFSNASADPPALKVGLLLWPCPA